MKQVNILSLTQAYRSLEEETLQKYLHFFKTNPKPTELKDLSSFVDDLLLLEDNIEIYDCFYYGYQIPQISKEFDLLRIGEDFVVNVEIKSTNTGEKLGYQLERNKYYLSFLGLEVFSYTYVSDEKSLYSIDNHNKVFQSELADLIDLLNTQEIDRTITNLDTLFNPSNYLVSPFNSTRSFIRGRYFLTNQQEECKNKIIKLLERPKTSFVSICGKAGTGKTLLTYDIAKHCMNLDWDVVIVHCGKLNDGHNMLKTAFKWNVVPAKLASSIDFSDYKLVVVDEVQRMFPSQLDLIINEVKKQEANCIFSYDAEQCLRTWEINNNIPQRIDEKANSDVFQLTEKIRTNKEIATFINLLFDKGKAYKKVKMSNIQINYFKSYDDAKEYVRYLNKMDWKVINYTPSNRYDLPYEKFALPNQDNAHDVVGQEYDKVVVVLDSYFYYDGNKLSTRAYPKHAYYHPTKMLFQMMTRTRKQLSIVVISNHIIMDRCLTILDSSH
ncbi:DUF2075 domain-containing protein [Flagellimonas olearia]|uniref:DUF2075 domain-containing protein n=1 Tax=Flagellimonas olearia TaxID=552546 RepID=A0A6I1DX81_9FLAO|nr:ATP-binding protein [Allomuricauda olearia]KAB7528441.1 DUF2075 domain-containing protein [Allomuricauda olearia]